MHKYAPRRTLILNASYEPLTTVSYKRAVILVLQEKAEMVEVSERVVRSEKQEMIVPQVIRLLTFVNVPYRVRTPLTRRGVLARDNYECCYCTVRKATTIDHVQPRSRNGRHRWENVVAACSKCNAFKDARTPAEALHDPAGKKIGFGAMRFEPHVPSGPTALVVAIGRMEPSWERYLMVG